MELDQHWAIKSYMVLLAPFWPAEFRGKYKFQNVNNYLHLKSWTPNFKASTCVFQYLFTSLYMIMELFCQFLFFQRCLYTNVYSCMLVHVSRLHVYLGTVLCYAQSQLRVPGNMQASCLRSTHSIVMIGQTDKWTDRRWNSETCVWAWWLEGKGGCCGKGVAGTGYTVNIKCILLWQGSNLLATDLYWEPCIWNSRVKEG